MKILFISGREAGYTRNRVILRGLRENRVNVIECTSSAKSYSMRYLEVLKKWFLCSLAKESYDAIFVGYLGQPLVPIIRKITRNKPIIFDAFISLYDTIIFDRKKASQNSIVGKLSYFLDKYSCSLADKVLLDTEEHINYFCSEFCLDPTLFEKVFVGADDSAFYPREEKNSEMFTVYFQASAQGIFLPLHGFQYILEAAKLLEEFKDIKFKVIGKATSRIYRDSIKEFNLRNMEFIDYVPYAELPDYVTNSSVCLGIFGSTNKAHRVIPTKAFEALAMKKPLITAKTPAIEELLEDRKDALLCRSADPRSLADAILELRKNPSLRNKIAEEGYKTFKTKCTPTIIGREIKEIIEKVMGD